MDDWNFSEVCGCVDFGFLEFLRLVVGEFDLVLMYLWLFGFWGVVYIFEYVFSVFDCVDGFDVVVVVCEQYMVVFFGCGVVQGEVESFVYDFFVLVGWDYGIVDVFVELVQIVVEFVMEGEEVYYLIVVGDLEVVVGDVIIGKFCIGCCIQFGLCDECFVCSLVGDEVFFQIVVVYMFVFEFVYGGGLGVEEVDGWLGECDCYCFSRLDVGFVCKL